jgi:hypothetical protein
VLDANEWRRAIHATPGEERRAAPVRREAETDALEDLIAESQECLTGGQDEEEAPACSAVARDRAIVFLRAQADQARRFGFSMPLPRISTGPDGSMDLLWCVGTFELLVNFPANQTEPATFYGDNEGSDCIRGTIGPDGDSRSLLPWLVLTR